MTLAVFGRKHVWQVDQVGHHRRLDIQATQLDDRGISRRTEQRQILDDWVRFLSSTRTRIVDIDFVSRVPQELVDAVSQQRQLQSLAVKWGPYSDLEPLSSLAQLRRLVLGGASAITDLEPLGRMPALRSLVVDGPAEVADPAPLGRLVGLRVLTYGNGYPGSKSVVAVPDLGWVRPLVDLEELHLPGTRIAPDALEAILDLPRLTRLTLPLRRSYRKIVFDYAESHRAFAGVARDYRDFDVYRDSLR